MYSTRITFPILFKVTLLLSLSLFFGLFVVSESEKALMLSFGIFFITFCWFLFDYVEETKFIILFFFIYSLLPFLWGITISKSIPVIRAHRVATLIIILYFIKKRNLTKLYSNFFKENIFTLPIILLILSMFISSILSTSMLQSLYFTFSFILERLFLTVVIFSVFKTRKNIESLITVLCYSGFILSILAIVEHFTEYNIFTLFGAYDETWNLEAIMRDGTRRSNGPYGHPIAFGAYLALILPFILYRYRGNFSKTAFYMLINILGIMMTQSRGPQIGGLLILCLHYLFIERKYINILLFCSIPFSLLFINRIFIYFRELNPLTAQNQYLNASSSERVRQLIFYSYVIKKNIIFGYGLTEAPSLMRGMMDGSEGNYQNTIDNYYLLYTYFYGMVGLLTLLFLKFDIFRKGIKFFREDIQNDPLILTLLFGILSYTVINIIVALISYHYIFWVYLGMLARLLVNKREEINIRHASGS